MLNRNKLVQEIDQLSHKLFTNVHGDREHITHEHWKTLLESSSFSQQSSCAQQTKLFLPWQENIGDLVSVEDTTKPHYTILAVDGSQIYPDRHFSSADCFLINIGGCYLRYDTKSSAHFFSHPTVMLPEHILPQENLGLFSADIIDLKREELELQVGFEQAYTIKQSHAQTTSLLTLVDGSFVFNHLDNKHEILKNIFFNAYIKHLQSFYQNDLLMASYISLPRNKELVLQLNEIYCNKQSHDLEIKNINALCKHIDQKTDAQMLSSFLKPGMRSAVFVSCSRIAQRYPRHVLPCFFYLNVGKEIARIELPLWIAQNSDHVTLIAQLIMDQSDKGHGYPVCLAEAHEQAVVRGSDRDFYYHVIYKLGIHRSQKVTLSQKQIKKHSIGV